MLDAKKYLPVGSVVLLENGVKKAMIIGILQSKKDAENNITEHDYIGVTYPEGFIAPQAMFMFDHDMILDVVFRGYENPEREEFIEKLDETIKKLTENK